VNPRGRRQSKGQVFPEVFAVVNLSFNTLKGGEVFDDPRRGYAFFHGCPIHAWTGTPSGTDNG